MRGRPSRRPFSLITAIDFPCLRKRTVALGNDPPGLNHRPRSRTLKLNLLPIGVAHSKPRRAREINHRVAHTHEVLREIAALRAELKDAESSQVGYVLTGKESYLETFGPAKLRIDAHLKDLLQLTEDDPDQEHRLSSLEPRIGDRLAQLQAAIETRRQGGFEAARRIVASDE